MMAHHPNPFAMPASLWQATLRTDDAGAGWAEQGFETMAGVLSVQRFLYDEPKGQWQVDALFDGKPDMAELEARLALILKASGGPQLFWEVAPLPQKNWVLEVEQRYPPLLIGPFFVYSEYHEERCPVGMIPLRVDAGEAFGTGEHATTEGCLLAMAKLKKQGLNPKRVLDMGSGSGILAMAAHRLWPRAEVLGVDLDPIAARVARENAVLNGCGQALDYIAGEGYAHRRVGEDGKYELILANILARPLMHMAKDLRAVLAPGGRAVLSGLLNKQECMVLAAHRLQGISLVERWRKNGWSALVVG